LKKKCNEWNEHSVVVFTQKKMNWWECGGVVSRERINVMHEKLKTQNFKGKSLKGVSKTDMMSTFEIKNIDDATKLHDSIRLLFADEETTIPSKFKCPICDKTMKDPVIALDTKNYCRVCIEEYFKENKQSPEGKPLDIQGTLSWCPNHALEQEIDHFFTTYPHLRNCTEDACYTSSETDIISENDLGGETEGGNAGNGHQTDR